MNHTPTPHAHDESGQPSCRRYLRSLSDYFDGELDEDLCREIEAHMATCENCRIVVNTLSKTVMLYRQMPSPDLPNEVRERLYKVLDLQPYYHEPDESGAGQENAGEG